MESLTKFLDLAKDVWGQGVFGLNIGDLFIACVILYAFIILRQLFTKIIIAWLGVIAKRSQTHFDDKAIECLEGPIRLLPIALGVFIASEYLYVEGNFSIFCMNLVRSLLVFSIFWAGYNLTDLVSELLGHAKRLFTPVMVDWLQRAMKVIFFFIGAATILEVWGIEVGPIIAGLGLFGVAVALGAQDMFKNLISGVWVIAERRFNKGDWVKIEGVVEGTVEKIGFRSTIIRRFDKAPVYVPNTKLSDSAVINFSAMTHRRIMWKIGVEYKTTVDQLKQVRDGIENYLLTNDAFAKPEDVSTFVRIDSFNDSSIDILLYCFTNTTNWGEWLEIKEKLAYKVKEIVEDAGTSFAFPTQTIFMESEGNELSSDKFKELKPSKLKA